VACCCSSRWPCWQPRTPSRPTVSPHFFLSKRETHVFARRAKGEREGEGREGELALKPGSYTPSCRVLGGIRDLSRVHFWQLPSTISRRFDEFFSYDSVRYPPPPGGASMRDSRILMSLSLSLSHTLGRIIYPVISRQISSGDNRFIYDRSRTCLY